MDHKKFQDHVKALYALVGELEEMFPARPFTPDGHLVGSLGECLVADAYGLELKPPSNPGYDAVTKEGKKVEIKATQGKSVAFRSCPEHTIIIKINKDGTFTETYNGPGALIWQQFEGKQIPSNGQFQISLSKVAKLSDQVSENAKITRIK